VILHAIIANAYVKRSILLSIQKGDITSGHFFFSYQKDLVLANSSDVSFELLDLSIKTVLSLRFEFLDFRFEVFFFPFVSLSRFPLWFSENSG